MKLKIKWCSLTDLKKEIVMGLFAKEIKEGFCVNQRYFTVDAYSGFITDAEFI